MKLEILNKLMIAYTYSNLSRIFGLLVLQSSRSDATKFGAQDKVLKFETNLKTL